MALSCKSEAACSFIPDSLLASRIYFLLLYANRSLLFTGLYIKGLVSIVSGKQDSYCRDTKNMIHHN